MYGELLLASNVFIMTTEVLWESLLIRYFGSYTVEKETAMFR